jgi:hypothetical protein
MKGLPSDLMVVPAFSLVVSSLEDALRSCQLRSAHIETQRKLSQDQMNHV